MANEIPAVSDKNAASALEKDFKLLKKIVVNNKDDHRTFNQVTEDDSSEDNTDSSEFVFPTWGYAVAGVIVLAVAGAIIVIADRKKKNSK